MIQIDFKVCNKIIKLELGSKYEDGALLDQGPEDGQQP